MVKKVSIKAPSRGKDILADHRAWLARALEIANSAPVKGGSPHPSVKVGAVIVDAKGLEIAAASNRFAQGVDRRRPDRYEDGQKSLWINCAEQLALIAALRQRTDLSRARMYVTLEPCAICAGLIAEAGIKNLYVPVGAKRHYAKLKQKWRHSIEIGATKLAEGGVQVTAVDTDLDEVLAPKRSAKTGAKRGTGKKHDPE